MDLRLSGKTYAAIGAELGVTPERAGQYVRQGLEATKQDIAEHADALRAIEAERLHELFDVLRPMAQGGDLRAIDRYLKASESYRKLTGLDLRPPDDVGQGGMTIEVRFPWDHTPGGDVVDSTAEEIPKLGAGGDT